MEEQRITLRMDNSTTKTFIKAIELYKLSSGFLDYGEDIEECQNIKEQIITSIIPNVEKQIINLHLKNYHVFTLLNAIEFLNLSSVLLGYNSETEDCQIIKAEILCSILENKVTEG